MCLYIPGNPGEPGDPAIPKIKIVVHFIGLVFNFNFINYST